MSPTRAITALAAALLLWAAAVPAGAQQAPAPTTRVQPPPADWLGTVNHYRTVAGAAPATEEPAWADGLGKHLTYLVRTPLALRSGEYASAHTENPASEWFTIEGATAAIAANIGFGPNDREAVERWMRAPFHAVGILRPNLTRTAFARHSGLAALDVIRGVQGPGDPESPVLFPGPGSHNFLDRFVGETPDPTQPCGPGFTGLPLIALLPDAPPPGTTASLRLPTGAVVAEGPDLCVVTADSFAASEDPNGQTARAILAADDVVLVIPRRPLAPGAHDVTIDIPGGTPVAWSFAQVATFDDVPGDAYFVDSVRWLTANAITSGVTPGRYAPADPVTRGQMATFLHRFSGAPAPTLPLTFTDVSPTDPHATGIRWLAGTGITTGVAPGRFGPGRTITRAQMAAFLHRLAGQPAPTAPLGFTDVSAADPFSPAIRWLAESGITSGVTPTQFGPGRPVTRAQMATFLFAFENAATGR